MSATIAITGASSFAARPLLHALLRRELRRVVLCDSLDGLAELQHQLLPWCEQQGISTELQWWSQDMAAALQDLLGILRPGPSGDRAWCRVVEFAEEFGISVSYDPLVLGERRGG